jgi:hypothetical protein
MKSRSKRIAADGNAAGINDECDDSIIDAVERYHLRHQDLGEARSQDCRVCLAEQEMSELGPI